MSEAYDDPDADFERLAIHEAGHMVVGHELEIQTCGMRLARMRNDMGGDVLYGGLALGELTLLYKRTSWSIEDRRAAYLSFTLAGIVCEEIMLGGERENSDRNESDRRDADRLLGVVRDVQRKSLLERSRKTCARILSRRRAKIQALADAAMEAQRLSTDGIGVLQQWQVDSVLDR